MGHLLAIALGGALGSVARYLASQGIHAWLGKGFPYGTLTVNVLGSFVFGVLYVLLLERINVAAEWRAFLMIGFLGAFTTFSTFSMETLNLLLNGEYFKGVSNIILNVVLCVLAAWIGVWLARQWS
ncbi:MAG: fluoride efflux transporter CrcB [Gammaproteobacteria bacterium]|nr:fluoride efflux transporter CrcB [Gammaproteobacteria bacterium]